jgi:cytochrome P450
MKNEHLPHWDPTSEEVIRDQRAAYDSMRRKCPVARSSAGWTLFRHDDVCRVLEDHETFSNAVSQHLSVPNGMDPPEHTHYRSIIEPYFSAERMQVFEPRCREIARKLFANLPTSGEVEYMSLVAESFAVGVQCSFLGWPEALRDTLVDWMRHNQRATLAQDRTALAELAREFEALIDDLIEVRRKAAAGPDADITASLMHEKVWGRPLSNEELASILRNWTAGEIGTISAASGILAHFLASHPDVQAQLRHQSDLLPSAIDEILRIHGPLVSNRRVATKAVEIGGKKIAEGERITLNWISANRDEEVFGNPDDFRLDRNPKQNLLYGAGIHVCPGAPLARLELRVLSEELLAATRQVALSHGEKPTLAVYPASGFSALPLKLCLCGASA